MEKMHLVFENKAIKNYSQYKWKNKIVMYNFLYTKKIEKKE